MGSAWEIMWGMAAHLDVAGPPHFYPINMEGDTVLKMDMLVGQVLTDEQKKKNL